MVLNFCGNQISLGFLSMKIYMHGIILAAPGFQILEYQLVSTVKLYKNQLLHTYNSYSLNRLTWKYGDINVLSTTRIIPQQQKLNKLSERKYTMNQNIKYPNTMHTEYFIIVQLNHIYTLRRCCVIYVCMYIYVWCQFFILKRNINLKIMDTHWVLVYNISSSFDVN